MTHMLLHFYTLRINKFSISIPPIIYDYYQLTFTNYLDTIAMILQVLLNTQIMMSSGLRQNVVSDNVHCSR
jgi:hypothetical protein